jgi:hypothetical protein
MQRTLNTQASHASNDEDDGTTRSPQSGFERDSTKKLPE